MNTRLRGPVTSLSFAIRARSFNPRYQVPIKHSAFIRAMYPYLKASKGFSLDDEFAQHPKGPCMYDVGREGEGGVHKKLTKGGCVEMPIRGRG